MSEWPKTVAMNRRGGIISEAAPSPHRLQVIRADLGRELYEALKQATDEDWTPVEPPWQAVLDRYEREVGL